LERTIKDLRRCCDQDSVADLCQTCGPSTVRQTGFQYLALTLRNLQIFLNYTTETCRLLSGCFTARSWSAARAGKARRVAYYDTGAETSS